MSQFPPHGLGWRPTRGQELLLHVCLSEGRTVVDSWQEWKRTHTLDDIDGGSFRLLPMVYQNLKKHAQLDENYSKLRGVYKQTWFQNHAVISNLAGILKLLEQAGIRTLVTKGAALTITAYRDYGARPFGDSDILVPYDQHVQAIKLLFEQGWKSRYGEPDSRLALHHSMDMKHPNGAMLDLHWYATWESSAPHRDQDWWDAAVEIDVIGVKTLAFCATDQLLHALIHGGWWNAMSPCRWVADAMIVLRGRSPLDWDRFVEQVHKRQVSRTISSMLRYLKQEYAADIPDQVLDRLAAIPVSRREAFEYALKSRQRSVWHGLIYHPVKFNRLTMLGQYPVSVGGFARYLHHWWGVPLRSLPVQIVRRLLSSPQVL